MHHECDDKTAVGPLRLDLSSFDFSQVEERYCKIQDRNKAVCPEFVQRAMRVKTVVTDHNGVRRDETINTAQPGDAIVTGPTGERCVVKRDDFDKLYEPLTTEDGAVVPGKFLAKNIVKRLPNPTGREIVIIAPWGEEQVGGADCWIVESQVNGDRYLIEPRPFAETYRKL